LIPGYIDVEEVERIANFIADIDRRIPYTLLAFYPQYVMNDLPTTDRALAEDCCKIAKESGLEKVRIGNIGLIGD
jgi:pyruvate formate lyase activating enzyme